MQNRRGRALSHTYVAGAGVYECNILARVLCTLRVETRYFYAQNYSYL